MTDRNSDPVDAYDGIRCEKCHHEYPAEMDYCPACSRPDRNMAVVRVWKGRSSVDEAPDSPPFECVPVEWGGSAIWQDDPWFSSPPIGFDIHPDDRPATLYVHTNDSVRAPPKSDPSEWGRPIEQGLPFTDPGGRPFGCEVWGRVLFRVERGNTRD